MRFWFSDEGSSKTKEVRVPSTEISLCHVNFSVNYYLQKIIFPAVSFNIKQSVSSVGVKNLECVTRV